MVFLFIAVSLVVIVSARPANRQGARLALLLAVAVTGCRNPPDFVIDPPGLKKDSGPEEPVTLDEIEPVTFGGTVFIHGQNTAAYYGIFVAADESEGIEGFNGRGCLWPGHVTRTDGGVLLLYERRNHAPEPLREFSARRVSAKGGRSICSDRNATLGNQRFLATGTVLTEAPIAAAVEAAGVAILAPAGQAALWVTDGTEIHPVALPFVPRLSGAAAGKAYVFEQETNVLWTVSLDGGGAESTQASFAGASHFLQVGSDVVFRGCLPGEAECHLFRLTPGESPVQIADRSPDFWTGWESEGGFEDCVAHRGSAYCPFEDPSSGAQVGRYDPEEKVFSASSALTSPDGGGRKIYDLSSAGEDLLFATTESAQTAVYVLQPDGGVEQIFSREGEAFLDVIAWGDDAVIAWAKFDGGAVMTYDGETLDTLAPLSRERAMGVWGDELISVANEWAQYRLPVRRVNLLSGEVFGAPAMRSSPARLLGGYYVALVPFVTSPPSSSFNELLAQEVLDLSSDQVRFVRGAGSPFPLLLADGRLLYAEAFGQNRGAMTVGASDLSDVSPPTIHCPPEVVVERTTYRSGAVTGYPGADGGDAEGPVRLWYSQDPGFFPFGTTEVIAIAVDRGGNTAACTIPVTVR